MLQKEFAYGVAALIAVLTDYNTKQVSFRAFLNEDVQIRKSSLAVLAVTLVCNYDPASRFSESGLRSYFSPPPFPIPS